MFISMWRPPGFNRTIAIGLVGLALYGCKPVEPPPDLLKTQREVSDKANALGGQLQQQLDGRMKVADNT
jgi:hypothetical protein